MLPSIRKQRPVIAPSMLKCDFRRLEGELQRLEQAGAQVIHWDVMDAHFVPNLSYGALVIESLRSVTSLPFDAHLMISDPERYLEDYLRAGCDWITIHIEAVPEPTRLLREIRAQGRQAGLALNPCTSVEAILPYITECDLLLVMSVEPGFGGQAFIPSSIEKVAHLRQAASDELVISIDGGIGPRTIREPFLAGADLFVAGSSVFNASDYQSAIRDLQCSASGATGQS